MNISDDFYVDSPSSVVEILRMKEDHQTGQEHSLSVINNRTSSVVEILRRREDPQTGLEHSLSAINGSHRSLDTHKENHDKVNIQDKRTGVVRNNSRQDHIGSQDKITQVPGHTRKPAQSGLDNNHTHTPYVNEYQW